MTSRRPSRLPPQRPGERAGAPPSSLLDFAIAASLAVLPIMLGIVLLVGVVRPGDPELAAHAPAERHLSVRHVAALKTFEAAIVRRTQPQPALPDAAQLIAALPQCRSDWGQGWQAGGWLARLGLRDAPASPADRVAAQLKTLDAALLAFGSRANRRVAQPVGLDPARWVAAAGAALATPLEVAGHPERTFRLACADLAAALATLARGDAAMLETLAWRGSEGSGALARWRPGQQVEVAARQVARRNPWSGIPGCIYLGRQGEGDSASPSHFVAGPRQPQHRVCARPDMFAAAAAASGVDAAPPAPVAPVALAGEPGLADPADDARWSVPPSLQAMLLPLEPLRQPGAPGARRIVVDGAPVDVGASIAVTIDPALQALAQKTAACYTGRHDVCRALGMRRAEDADRPVGEQLLEGAMVRMAAVAVVDVATGRIEALAGALSPCARQEVDGPGRDPGCDPRLPYPVQYRPDALLNPAVFHDAMPASTIKPIMAAAFLADRGVGARWLAGERAAMARAAAPARDSLRGQLMRSDSARFLDRMFCLDQGFADCRRAWDVQATAAAFGWNAGCAEASAECGRHDLLFGGAAGAAPAPGAPRAATTTVSYGRLMSEPRGARPGAPMRLRPPAALDPRIVGRCATGGDGRRLSDDDWEKCRGGAVVDVVAEGWGQGHARASAIGVAGMMATLAAAANGQAGTIRPHLVASLAGRATAGAAPVAHAHPTGVGGGGLLPVSTLPGSAAEANPLSRDAAEVILSGLSHSHRSGTARSACEQVFDARRCRAIDWLAGKTGTPSFPSDGVSLDALARLCRPDAPAPRAGIGPCSALRPYKWYVAAWRADAAPGAPWSKVIAVLSERNWLRRTGHVHGAGDHGPNPSAEIALQIAGRRLGAITGSAP